MSEEKGDLPCGGPINAGGCAMIEENIKRWHGWWILSLVIFWESGCVVGPQYHAPKVQVPGQWTGLASAGNASIVTSGVASVAEWWKSFQDPVLDSLISRAVQSNLGLQQAHSRILQARALRKIAGAGLQPSVNASASNTTSGSTGSTSTIGSGSSTRNLFQAGLDAAWEMDFFGGVRRGIEATDANLQAAVEDSRDVMVTLTAEVALDYIQLRGYQQEIAIAQKNLEDQRETAEITRKRFGVGFASGLDVANAEAQVATTQSQIPLLETSAQQTIYALSVLLGLEPSSLRAELFPAGSIPPTPPAVPAGLPYDLLERRPDILRAEAQFHAAVAQVGVATADLFPKFNLTGSGGMQNLTQGSLGNTASVIWSLGPSVTFPIYNAGKIRANIKVQQEAAQQALLAYRQAVLTALQDVESALIAYAKDQQHRAALDNAVKSNETAVDLSLKLYTAGEIEFLNLLTTQRNLYTSEDALVQADRAIDADLIALYKALGGGWQAQPDKRLEMKEKEGSGSFR
jgi:multidrug efflux system outer membrane protein